MTYEKIIKDSLVNGLKYEDVKTINLWFATVEDKNKAFIEFLNFINDFGIKCSAGAYVTNVFKKWYYFKVIKVEEVILYKDDTIDLADASVYAAYAVKSVHDGFTAKERA